MKKVFIISIVSLFMVCSCNTSSSPEVSALRFCKALSAGDEEMLFCYTYISGPRQTEELRPALHALVTDSVIHKRLKQCRLRVKDVKYKGDTLATVIIKIRSQNDHEVLVPFPMILSEGEWKVDYMGHAAFRARTPH